MKFNDIPEHAKEAEAVWGESYDVLWPIIKSKKYKIGAEIGVAFGGHSKRILDKTNSTLICVDPYKHQNGYIDSMNMSDDRFEQLYKFTKDRLSNYGKRCRIIREKSEVAAKIISEKLDFVYIDGDHSEEGIRQDILSWFPKINDGGIIAGHDYNHPGFPGIKKVVDKFFKRFNWKINTHKSGAWWVEKKTLNISYIIPAYNCEKTIRQSVNSLYLHNFNNEEELIIVNDSSTDSTPKLLKEIKNKYNNITIYNHKTNEGGGAARNTAIKLAKNELIFCLDSDNVLSPYSISKLKQNLIDKFSDASSFEQIRFFKEKTNIINHKWNFSEESYSSTNFLESIKTPGASGNYLFTKNSWISAGGYPIDTFLDTWGFGLRQAMTGSIISITPHTYYFHRVGHESYWVRNAKKTNPSIQATRLILEYYNTLPNETIDAIFNKKTRENWLDNLDKYPLTLTSSKTNNNFWKFFKK